MSGIIVRLLGFTIIPISEHFPDSNSGIDACIMINNVQDEQDDAKLAWKNNNCEIRLQYVCEVPAGYEPPTTIEPPTIPPPIPCNADNPSDLWKQFPIDQGGTGEYCYLFSDINQKNWIEANEYCIYKGGRLASVHSVQENDFIVHNFAHNGIGWIGFLKDGPTDSFTWTDGTSPDFYRWGKKRKRYLYY